MNEKALNRPQTETGIDFQSLELEIDKEIDNLFVPMQKAADPPEPLAAAQADAGESAAPVAVAPSPGKAAPKLDLDALQVEIDKEIDSLFVPFTPAAPDAAAESPILAMEAERLEVPEPAASPAVAVQPHSAKSKARDGEDDYPALSIEYEEYPSGDELPRLVEVFNAAYLSLDWDVSRQNILKLQNALKALESFASRYSTATSLYKVLNVILSRVYARPQSANSKIFELIRDSQELLAHILLVNGETGSEEKARLDDLMARFMGMREKAAASRLEARAAKLTPTRTMPLKLEPASPPAPEQPRAASAPPRVAQPSTKAEIGDEPASEPSALIRETSLAFEQTRSAIEAEIARLRQIETVLRKSAALAPVANRLEGIRTGLELQARSLREKEEQWSENASRLVNSAASAPEGKVAGQSAKTPMEEAPARKEDVCIVGVAGKQLALPTDCVLKTTSVNSRKIANIVKKGHACLADTRPLFRSLKSGIIGKWAAMPAKVLGSYSFAVANQRDQAGPLPIPDRGIAVYASDGTRHGVFIAETVEFVSAPVAGSKDGTESAEPVPGTLIPVLNPGRVFSGGSAE
ncbi:MAG: hypothetical protein LLG06_10110 [Desulfobacteraceae bacterium]|nr:hypothetical protein [Desulfobacteraceae bacterium]